MSISASTEHLVAAQKSAFDTLHAFANASLNSIEKFNALTLATARNTLSEKIESASSLLSAKDPQEIFGIQNSLLQPQIEKAIAYWHELHDISAEAQETWVKLLESQHAELNRNISSLLDGYAKSTANSDVAVAAVKSAISVANSAFENVNKAARRVTGIAGAGVSATVQAVGAANQGQANPGQTATRKKAA